MMVVQRILCRPYLYALIALTGVILKFYHLDHKLLWIDEVYTIQHTSGIPDNGYPAMVPVNEIRNASFYQDLYRLRKQGRPLIEELRGLAALPTLNPLHYPLLMLWYRIVGDDPVHFRAFSVLIFLMTLPILYLLAFRLFDSRIAGWIAASLYAVSPYVHLFAQEARYYILWSCVLVLLHYVLLEAVRSGKRGWWVGYASAVALSLYCSPISIIIIGGHGAFVMLTRRHLWSRFGISVLCGALAYLPWAVLLFLRRDAVMAGLAWQAGNQHNVAAWLPLFGQGLFLVSVFSFRIDYLSVFTRFPSSMGPDIGIAAAFNILVFAMLLVAALILIRRTGKDIALFLVLITLPGLLCFLVYDLMRHSMTSWWWRYLMFAAPAMILVMTNAIFKRVEKGSIASGVAYGTIAFIGIASIGAIADARHWHIGDRMNTYLENARVIGQSKKPLLVTDCAGTGSMVDIVVVLHACPLGHADILRVTSDSDAIGKIVGNTNYSDVFLISPSDVLVRHLTSRYPGVLERTGVEGEGALWRFARLP